MLKIANGDEWMLAGWHGAGNSTPERKLDSGIKHVLNIALSMCPDIIIFGEHDDAPMGEADCACHAAGFVTYLASGRGVDGIYSFCADLPDSEQVQILGRQAEIGQLRLLGCEADGEALEVSALRAMPLVGPKTAAAILEEGDPLDLFLYPRWMPRCRAAEKVRAGLSVEAYSTALEALRLRRVQLQQVEGPRGPDALRALGLGKLASLIEGADGR